MQALASSQGETGSPFQVDRLEPEGLGPQN
ncbi:hypothetical protein EYZ11_002250 [Aspergillus tanneri]|uniref:Uncharacterized protein n=1 Tax=Aspergillus tanneri TaxID=1220188 RepID=A0A4S3JT56_9EURO|nr:hypothetical protein EYZ11_002250 [Aspergillus tanneri]